jgi:hypothetical protein
MSVRPSTALESRHASPFGVAIQQASAAWVTRAAK